MWSWDISYLRPTVCGIWLYLYLVIDRWSRKAVALEGDEREDPVIAADLFSGACLRERISKSRAKPLILHADNGNTMRATTLEAGWKIWACSDCSRGHGSKTTTHFSICLFPTVKYRMSTPRKPFESKGQPCEWVAALVDWYNHRHRHNAIKFVRPVQRQGESADAIYMQRAEVYEKARRANPMHWSRNSRGWHQPEEVWINKPIEETNPIQELPIIQAA